MGSRTGRASRKPGVFSVSRRMAICGAAIVVGLLSFAGSAGATDFGGRYLQEPCGCGDALYGTSSAMVANFIVPDPPQCVAFSDFTSDSSGFLIQAGLVRCGNLITADGTCSLHNDLVRFVEVKNSSGFHCYQHGSASTGVEHDAAVQAYSGNSWSSWLDGTFYEGTTQSHLFITSHAEYTGSGSSCTAPWSGSVTLGGGPAYPWQRLKPDRITWFTIQSAPTQNGGCWTITGGPPGSFTVAK
jgi:hypothetical protein